MDAAGVPDMRIRIDPKRLRTGTEEQVGPDTEKLFASSAAPIERRIENFPVYFRRKSMTRLLALYEVFKEALEVKGSIVECGVHRGFGLMAWAKFSSVLEPADLTRRVYGFDTFEGFSSITNRDQSGYATHKPGDLKAEVYEELQEAIRIFDNDRFLGHVPKVHLVKGDATKTIPQFIEQNQHLVVSLLYMDFDLYEPARVAIEHFVPRMPKGAIIAFDELDNPLWPGETMALLETVGINKLRLRRVPWDPYIAYARIE